MPIIIDHHPDQRELQISIARWTLRAGNAESAELRDACEVILSLSNAPDDRLLAEQVLRSLDA